MGRFEEKASVEVDHTEVAAEFAGGAREGDRLESGDAVREGAKARAGYFISEEGHGGEGDLAFLDIDEDSVFGEAYEKLTKVTTMFCGVLGEDEDVIQVAEDEIQSLGNFVEETLEGLTGVSETETHEGEFEEAERGNDCLLYTSPSPRD